MFVSVCVCVCVCVFVFNFDLSPLLFDEIIWLFIAILLIKLYYHWMDDSRQKLWPKNNI